MVVDFIKAQRQEGSMRGKSMVVTLFILIQ